MFHNTGNEGSPNRQKLGLGEGEQEREAGARIPEVRSLEGYMSFSVPAGKADRKTEVYHREQGE